VASSDRERAGFYASAEERRIQLTRFDFLRRELVCAAVEKHLISTVYYLPLRKIHPVAAVINRVIDAKQHALFH
jgi:hypothetical protein